MAGVFFLALHPWTGSWFGYSSLAFWRMDRMLVFMGLVNFVTEELSVGLEHLNKIWHVIASPEQRAW